MGSRTINWCDRCGRKNSKTLTNYWFGNASVFGTGFINRENNRAALCPNCLDYVKRETTQWIKYQKEET